MTLPKALQAEWIGPSYMNSKQTLMAIVCRVALSSFGFTVTTDVMGASEKTHSGLPNGYLGKSRATSATRSLTMEFFPSLNFHKFVSDGAPS